MCRPTDMLREALGITDYVPGTRPHARIRKPTWHGARGRPGNGAVPADSPPSDPIVERLAQEHRLIRQLMNDIARSRGRGPC